MSRPCREGRDRRCPRIRVQITVPGTVRGEAALPEQHGDACVLEGLDVPGDGGVGALSVVPVGQGDDRQAEPDALA